MAGRASFLLRWIFSMLLLLSIYSPPGSAADQVVLQGYTISFNGVTYNSQANTSTWSYHVVFTAGNVGSEFKALSNISFGMCSTHTVLSATPGHWELRRGGSVSYIKFEYGVSKTDPVGTDFRFTLSGMWQAVDMPVEMKAGQPTYTGTIKGPGCQEGSCQVNVTASNGLLWQIRKPGVYAAKAITLALQGQAGARIYFYGFTNLEHGDPDSLVQVAYAIGDTVEAAELYGWRTAGYSGTWDGTAVTVSAADVMRGYTLTVWTRLSVLESTPAFDFAAEGRVTVTPICGTG